MVFSAFNISLVELIPNDETKSLDDVVLFWVPVSEVLFVIIISVVEIVGLVLNDDVESGTEVVLIDEETEDDHYEIVLANERVLDIVVWSFDVIGLDIVVVDFWVALKKLNKKIRLFNKLKCDWN